MNLIKAEFKKTLTELISYYPDLIVGLFTDILLLVIVINTAGNAVEKVFAYILWILASGVLSEASICISTEKQLGTLQNLMTKPFPIVSIICAKTMVWFFVNFIKSISTTIIAALFFGINDLCRFDYLIIIICVCIGIMGLSLVLSAMTLVFTKVASFVTIISYMFLFLSGSIVNIPKPLVYTNPLSYGAFYMSRIANGNSSINDLFILLIISLLWLLIGYILFKCVFKRSKQFKWTY